MIIVFVLAVALAAAGALFDWRTGHIPNKLTHGAIGIAPILHLGLKAWAERGFTTNVWIEGGLSIVGILFCGLVPWLMFWKNAIGAGDVKLLAGIGGLLGPMLGMEAELYSFIAACLIAPAFLAYEGKLLPTMKNALFLLLNPFLKKERRREASPQLMSWFRMGPSIFIGTLLACAFARAPQ